MTLIPQACLGPSDLTHLGTNVLDAIRQDHEELAAMSRSLDALGEPLDPGSVVNHPREPRNPRNPRNSRNPRKP
jgi:hypothetical protein